MDPRIREQAEILVDHSMGIESGDDVVVDAAPESQDLVVALHERLADVGANPLVITDRTGKRFRRAYLRNHDGDFEVPDHQMALYETMDAYVVIQGWNSMAATADVSPQRDTAFEKAMRPLLNERLSKTWCVTHFPNDAHAQLAEMATEEYEDYVWDAIVKDWDAVREHQQGMVEILDPAEEVRIVSGDTTDVTMSVAGNTTLNDYGEMNMPGGEVFTAPVPDSVEGEVLFDVPIYYQSSEIADARLVFEDGRVVEHGAGKNEELLTEILNADEGSDRLGELGIGMNRDIDRPTKNILFDEKMGDTVHMAVGRAYPETLGEGVEHNDSSLHVDMIVDMSEDSYIEVDGERVQEDGTFVFEE